MNVISKRVRITMPVIVLFSMAALCWPLAMMAKDKKEKRVSPAQQLADYSQRVRQTAAASPGSVGSLWTPGAGWDDLASDYKARNRNDLIVIRIVEQTNAQANASVKSARTFEASSGISGLLGQVGPRSGLQTIFSPHSSRTLDGQAQTASRTDLQTSLAGHVADVLPNGVMIVQASREIEVNNERQTIIVRGLVRPGDVLPDNSVFSTSMSNLEVELKGKGVISDGVRPPNRIIRSILWLVGF